MFLIQKHHEIRLVSSSQCIFVIFEYFVKVLDIFLGIYAKFTNFVVFSIFPSTIIFIPDIQSKRFDITGFVELLGPYLTSTEVGTRANAVKLLSLTLSELPVDFLSAVQLNFITTFFCDRLKDHHSIIPNALIGIQAMVKMTNLPDECASRVLQALFQNVSCQSQLRPDRTAIFNIISDLCDSKTKGNLQHSKNKASTNLMKEFNAGTN